MLGVFIGLQSTLRRDTQPSGHAAAGPARAAFITAKTLFQSPGRGCRKSRIEGYQGELAKSIPLGVQKRLEIARALATQPQLVLLDEPAAGMNPQETEDLMEFILQVKKDFDLTVLLIEHDMRVVMGICQRIKVLDYGATIAVGLGFLMAVALAALYRYRCYLETAS